MQDSDGEASENGGFEEEERRALRQIAQDYMTNSMSRRAALALGAGATAGAAGMGGFAVGQASAQPTGDEGSIGTSGDRVEAWMSEADANSIDADEFYSRSIPTQVRLFKDGSGNAVAIANDGNSPIASGSDHASVIQAAADYVYNNRDTSGPEQKNVPGIVDGGSLSFTLTSSVTVKDSTHLCNCELDAAGNTGFVPLEVHDGSEGAVFNTVIDNVTVANSGDSDGIVCHLGYGSIRNTTSIGNGGSGLVSKGSIAKFYNCRFQDNGTHGMLLTDYGTSGAGNFNRVTGSVFYNNIGENLRVAFPDVSGKSVQNIVRDCEFDSAGSNHHVFVLDAADKFQLKDCWFEGTKDINIGYGKPSNYCVVEDNRINSLIEVDGSTGTRLRGNYAEDGGSLDITISSNATDTIVEYNHLNGGTFTDNGTGTQRTTY